MTDRPDWMAVFTQSIDVNFASITIIFEIENLIVMYFLIVLHSARQFSRDFTLLLDVAYFPSTATRRTLFSEKFSSCLDSQIVMWRIGNFPLR